MPRTALKCGVLERPPVYFDRSENGMVVLGSSSYNFRVDVDGVERIAKKQKNQRDAVTDAMEDEDAATDAEEDEDEAAVGRIRQQGSENIVGAAGATPNEAFSVDKQECGHAG